MMISINEAVKAALDEWTRNQRHDIDIMADHISWLVQEAISEWAETNPNRYYDIRQDNINPDNSSKENTDD